MKKSLVILASAALLMSSCAGEYNKVFKSDDLDYRYEFAKQCFAEGNYNQAATLLLDLVTVKKGTDDAQESLYMLAMSQYMSMDFESASETFKRYYQTYPKGYYAEPATFYVGHILRRPVAL